MVNLGNRVSAIPLANAATVEIDVQTATFNKNRPQYRYAGIATELDSGVWAVHDVAAVTYDDQVKIRGDDESVLHSQVRNSIISSYRPGVQPSSTDTFNWFRTQFSTGRTPQTELIVTISVKSSEQIYLARNTSAYYIADGDESNYLCSAPGDTPDIPVIPVKGECHINRQCN